MAQWKLKYTAFTVGKTSEKHSERACDMLPVILNVHVSHQQFPAGERNFSVSNFTGILSCFLSLLLLYYYWAMQLSRGPTLVPSEIPYLLKGILETKVHEKLPHSAVYAFSFSCRLVRNILLLFRCLRPCWNHNRQSQVEIASIHNIPDGQGSC